MQILSCFFKKRCLKKATQASDIPAKIFKQNTDIFVDYICMLFKKWVDQGNFPFVQKHASIMLVFNESRRGSVDNLKNYCVITWKANINILWNNLYLSINTDFNAQLCLFGMLEKWKRFVDQRKRFKEVSWKHLN